MKVNQWISQLKEGGQFYRLFEHAQNLMFFAKDRESNLILGNHRFLEHCGLSTLEDLSAKTDHDIFPKYMADKFRHDDKTVVSTGKPFLELVELFPTRDRLPS